MSSGIVPQTPVFEMGVAHRLSALFVPSRRLPSRQVFETTTNRKSSPPEQSMVGRTLLPKSSADAMKVF
jgi:hypothetical protein